MKKTDLVQSLLRGLDILELVARSQDGASLAEIAEHIGVGRPAAYNLARTLAAREFVVKTRRPVRYRLGPAAARLLALQAHNRLRGALRSALRRTAAALPETWVYAGEPAGGETLITLRLDPASPETVEEPLYRVSPAYHTATALAVYAFSGDDFRQAVEARHPFDEDGLGFRGNRDQFEKFIAESRDRGFVLLEQPQCRIVLPVRDGRGEFRAVLGLSFGNNRRPSSEERARAHAVLVRVRDDVQRTLAAESAAAPGENVPPTDEPFPTLPSSADDPGFDDAPNPMPESMP